jgi:hypothetical protein
MSRALVVFSSLALFLCSVAFAQNESAQSAAKNELRTSALLRTEGKSIKVNGAVVPTTMTIFENDRIQTGADTVAHVILPGRILTLDRKSTAVFRDGTLVVRRGRAWLAGVGAAGGATTMIAAAGAGGASIVAPTGLVAARSLAATTSSRTATTTATDDNDDHFTGICATFSASCDQAEDACESKNHRECVCHYVSDRDKDDVSPIKPDSDDFKCSPVKK